MPCKVGPEVFHRKAKRDICTDGQLSDRVDPALRVKVRPFPGILVMQRHGFVILEWYLIGYHPPRPIIGEKTSCGLIGTIGVFFPTHTKFIISCVSLNLAFHNSWSKADFSSIMENLSKKRFMKTQKISGTFYCKIRFFDIDSPAQLLSPTPLGPPMLRIHIKRNK